jgi:hypothetical protein
LAGCFVDHRDPELIEHSEPVKKSSAGDRQAVVNMRSLPHEQRAFAVS